MLIDSSITAGVKLISKLLNRLPVTKRLRVVELLTALVFAVIRRPLRIARINLSLAYPELSFEERERILKGHRQSFARLVVDALRLPDLDRDWISGHIEAGDVEVFRDMKSSAGASGILIVTGHQSSFELLAHVAPFYGFPMAFVARRFGLPRLNEWFCEIRERFGNVVIDRKGATKQVLQRLQQGQDVGVLLDHNVTRNHATFVDFFGLKAATSKLAGIAAVRTACPVCVASILHEGDDNYRLVVKRCDTSTVMANEALSLDEKVQAITQLVTTELEKVIRQRPEQWFWIHSRWKTRPSPSDPSLYTT